VACTSNFEFFVRLVVVQVVVAVGIVVDGAAATCGRWDEGQDHVVLGFPLGVRETEIEGEVA
jgi:hypothetical protein